jgi:hypothetical protein
MELKEALENLPFICEMTDKQVEAVKVLEEKIDDLKTLVDGASIAVELFNTTTPAQIEWRKKWLEKYKEIL